MKKQYITLDNGYNWCTYSEAERLGDLLQLAGKWDLAAQALDTLDAATREAAHNIAPCSCGQYLREYMRLYKRDVVLADVATTDLDELAEEATEYIWHYTPATLREALNNIILARRGLHPSAWTYGVYSYAVDLIEDSDKINRLVDLLHTMDAWEPRTNITRAANRALLASANSWTEYSYGGGALIYDHAIAKRLCTPSELERCKGGERRPNSREIWLDTQARALTQAADWITSAIASMVQGTL